VDQIKRIILLILNPGVKYSVVGFKEIRWSGNLDLIDEFIELFPNTKVVLHIRTNVTDQSLSGWWKFNPTASHHIVRQNNEMIEYAQKYPEKCFLSTFEGMFDVAFLAKLFLYLEEPMDKSRVLAILQTNLAD
jgi:hypothetical protein